MKRLQPVIWMKGTLLSPQYLQSQDRFLENSLKFQLDGLNFAPWGFRRLQLNQDALASGYVAIADAAGIFPDGLLFDIPDADAAPSPKPLADCFEADQKTLDVFLAIPHFRDRGLNVSMPQTKADTRYLSEIAMLRDENSGLAERPVQVARKNFRILVEGESQQHSSVLRIARIERTAAVGHYSQRFSGVDPAEVGRDPGGQEQPTGRIAPAKESQPGGLWNRRYRQFLAAVYHQFPFPADAA